MEMKFWAVLGRRGCREKKLPTAMSMQLFGVVFSTFCGQKELKKYPKNCILMADGSFFSAALTAQNSPELHFHFINSFIQPSLVGSLMLPHNSRLISMRMKQRKFEKNCEM